jgi:hypothetical protein
MSAGVWPALKIAGILPADLKSAALNADKMSALR